MPASLKDYIHRVGRTTRAGRGGMAITLVTQYDVDRVKQIEATINTKLVEFETNENEVLPLLRAVMVARREAQSKVRSSAVLEKRMINKGKKMLLEGKDPDDVKAVKRKRRQKKLTEKEKISKLGSDSPNRVKIFLVYYYAGINLVILIYAAV